MSFRTFGGLVLAGSLALGSCAFAQDDSGTKQSMKNAGSETKAAAKDTGHGVKQGSKKAYHKTSHATVKASKKTATGTRNVGRRVEGKEPVPNNPK